MASSSRPKPTSRAGKSSGAKSPESFQSLNKRNAAAEILQSYEKLSWYSMQRCESLTQTRLHFQNVVAGLADADETALIDWKDDLTPRGEQGKREKGKERESIGEARANASSSTMLTASGSAKKKRKSDGRIVS